MVKIPIIPSKIRNETRSTQERLGQKKFYKKLVKLDPLVKNKINRNDVQRSIRAFEIKKFTKKSMIKWFSKTKVFFDINTFLKIYLDFPRGELIDRINRRVDAMFQKGAISEVIKFNKLKVKKQNSSNKVIGIQEIGKYLTGELDFKETKERICIKTRQYAKRQTTWARGQMKSWYKIDPNSQNIAIKNLNNLLLNLTN